MSAARPTDSITDFGQFNALRRGARVHDDAAVRKAAQQFEALFTQQMLKSARAASLGPDVMGGEQTGFYQDMFDQQMAVHLSSGKGLGLADMLVRQLRGSAGGGADAVAASSGGSSSALAPSSSSRLSAMPIDTGRGVQAGHVADTSAAAGVGSDRRAAFVQKILPHAERAAQALGVPTRVLIAQAALETGWGQHAIQHRSGQSGQNYFGIKADSRWSGASVGTTTTEYANGAARSEHADFRSYDSAAASFDDYVKFLKSNPRYADALNHGGSASHFVQGLQKAGYASDPAYAQKILRIANGPTMQLALNNAPRTVTA